MNQRWRDAGNTVNRFIFIHLNTQRAYLRENGMKFIEMNLNLKWTQTQVTQTEYNLIAAVAGAVGLEDDDKLTLRAFYINGKWGITLNYGFKNEKFHNCRKIGSILLNRFGVVALTRCLRNIYSSFEFNFNNNESDLINIINWRTSPKHKLSNFLRNRSYTLLGIVAIQSKAF